MEEQAKHAFPSYCDRLRAKDPAAWQWLMGHFEERVKPWLFQKVAALPKGYNMARQDFVEEVFAQATYKFYDLFQNGHFETLSDLRGLMFRVAEFAVKEGYQKVKRDQKLYFSDEIAPESMNDMNAEAQAEKRKQEALETVRAFIRQLPRKDQDILGLYLDGLSFQTIALRTGLTEPNCRKRKQRALEQVKHLFFSRLHWIAALVHTLGGLPLQ